MDQRPDLGHSVSVINLEYSCALRCKTSEKRYKVRVKGNIITLNYDVAS